MRKLLFFLALMSSAMSQAQLSYVAVDAGPDIQGVNCGEPQNLHANVADLREASQGNYTVESIPYSSFPSDPGVVGPNATEVVSAIAQDDTWSDVVPLGFDVCYFGDKYDSIVIGSNGNVSFNTSYASSFVPWDLGSGGMPYTLPQANNDNNLPFLTIFGVGHDMDPKNEGGHVWYEVVGQSPHRAMVVKFIDVGLFDCGNAKTTSMIVLYEDSANIEVYVREKGYCSWNDNYALIGINDVNGVHSATPPNRNTSSWVVNDTNSEAWRFVPNDTTQLPRTISWTDSNGLEVGTTEDITVNPPGTETYNVTVTYTVCSGEEFSVSDDVEVYFAGSPLVDLGADTVLCDTAPMVLDATPSNAANFTTLNYLWSTGETTPTITATSSGDYSVTVTVDGGCMATDEITLGFGITPVITFPDAPYQLCHAVSSVTNDPVTITAATVGQDASQFTYAWTEVGNSTILSTTATLDVTEPGTYTVVVTGGSCSATETVTVDYYSNEFCVYPQGISPNNDQLNDHFDLEWLNDMKGIKNIKIFNRYGKVVYDKNDYANEFEGVSDNDYDLPTGTYFYVLSLADETVKEGYLYINR